MPEELKLNSRQLDEKLASNIHKLRTGHTGPKKDIGVGGVKKISDKARMSRNKARILRKMDPTLERALQILSGLIACPEGGVTAKLNYRVSEVAGISAEKSQELLTAIEDFCDVQLKLSEGLHEIIHKVISETGAHVEVYIPTSTAGQLLATESADSSSVELNRIKEERARWTAGTAYFTNDITAIVPKNPILKSGVVGVESRAAKRRRTKNKATSRTPEISKGQARIIGINKTMIGLESDGKIGGESVIVRTTTGESIIPIMYNGRVIKYIGILDGANNFLSGEDDSRFSDLMDNSSSFGSNKASNDVLNSLTLAAPKKDNQIGKEYQTIRKSIEDMVINSVVDEQEGKDDIGSSILRSLGDENVLDIITSRALTHRKTNVIMIDPDFVSYFALIRDEHGCGISAIEDNTGIILMHVTLLYAKIMSELESSIPETKAEITLDSNTSNPMSNVRDIVGSLLKDGLGKDYDFDFSGTGDLFSSLSNMNTSVKVNNAEVSGMPNMDIDITRTQRDVRGPTDSLLETINKFSVQSLGVSHERVTSSYGERFKNQVTRENDITNRQLARYTSAVAACMSDRVRMRVGYNDELWLKLCTILDKSHPTSDKVESRLREFLAKLTVTLPDSDMQQMESFNEKLDVIGKSFETYFEYIITDTLQDNGETIQPDILTDIKQTLTGRALRAFCHSSALFDGMGMDLTTMEGISKALQEEIDANSKAFNGISKSIKRNLKAVKTETDKVEAVEEEPAPVEEESTDESEGAVDEAPADELEEATEGGESDNADAQFSEEEAAPEEADIG